MPARSPGERGRADTRRLSRLGCPASEPLPDIGRQPIYPEPPSSSRAAGWAGCWRRPSVRREDSVMIDHLAIQCADVTVSAAFYDAVLAPVGGRRAMDFGDVIGYGVPPMPEFWIGPLTTGDGFRESHVAFTAPDRAARRAVFQAAAGAGRGGAGFLPGGGGRGRGGAAGAAPVAGVPPQLLRGVRAGSGRHQRGSRLPRRGLTGRTA